MSKNLWSSAMLATAAWLVGGSASALEVGDSAPGFRLPGTDGATHDLEQLRGKRGVVLAWFPRAFTPG